MAHRLEYVERVGVKRKSIRILLRTKCANHSVFFGNFSTNKLVA